MGAESYLGVAMRHAFATGVVLLLWVAALSSTAAAAELYGSVYDAAGKPMAGVVVLLEHMSDRDVVFVGHSHFSRSVITRWVELPLVEGSRFWMLAGSIAVCGFEHGVRQLAALGLTSQPQAIKPG